MNDEPDLSSAYGLRSAEDAKRLYADWAETYDSAFGQAQGYVLPREVVRAFVQAGGVGPVLDVGAGTGLVGEGLAASGVGPVDGLDLSQEMLEVADKKGVYRSLIAADVTRPLDVPHYNGVVSAGTFTLGHVGPDGLLPLLNVADRGCLFVISVNAAHFESAGFEALLAKLETKITEVQMQDVRIYTDKADLSHRYDMARLLIFRTV